MNVYERPFAERLQAEAERIPLPPRERWTPQERSRPRLLSVLAALALLALVALVVGPVTEQLRLRTGGVAPSSSSSAPKSVAGAAPLTCAPLRDRTTQGCLLPGTLVEIVGHDGSLMASTPLVRVKLESAELSAQFGNPTLFETDANTQIEPTVIRTPALQGSNASAPTVAATGVKVGARVLVAFDSGAPKTSSDAYLLTRFVVVSSGALPDCLVGLHIDTFPRGDTTANGGAAPEAAFRKANPTIVQFSMYPMGKDPKAPVWIVAGSETFIATILTDGTWFVSSAKFLGCRDPQEVQRGPSPSRSPTPTFPMNTLGVAPDPTLPVHVAAGMPAGAAIFAQSEPTCALEADGKTYRCILKNAPAPEISNFLGTKELLVIAGTVAGGCVGLDRDGMTWNCFLGQGAVDHGIIDKALLGQPAPVPGRG
jgi:hypothetical protein